MCIYIIYIAIATTFIGVITIAIATTFRTSTFLALQVAQLSQRRLRRCAVVALVLEGRLLAAGQVPTLDPLELRDLIWLVVTGTMEFCDCPYTLW